MSLALPLMVNSAVQLILNLTDAWFIGRLSTEAVAAQGAVHFLAIVFLLAVGGVGFAVQTLVAQAYGAGRNPRASRSVWLGVWAALITAPVFIAVALTGGWLMAPFGLSPAIERLAVDYWMPRLLGGPFIVVVWAITGFFNGIGRTRVTLVLMLIVALLNALLNEIFIFWFGLGIGGSAWATTVSMIAGAGLAGRIFLARDLQSPYRTRKTWRPTLKGIKNIFTLGIPTGVFPAVDLVAISLFQIMQVRLGPIPGAATQIVMMLTALAYMPAIGIAMAGTTLVGQSIGAGNRVWAERLGNRIIVYVAAYMGIVGVAIALAGPWLIPLFIDAGSTGAKEVIHMAVILIWIAGAYQLFDALNLASAFCLRGAGDVRAPTAYLIVLAWFIFVPMAHMFSFTSNEGWVTFLPQFGWGAIGGWAAALIYIFALGVMMLWRWRSGAWKAIRLT